MQHAILMLTLVFGPWTTILLLRRPAAQHPMAEPFIAQPVTPAPPAAAQQRIFMRDQGAEMDPQPEPMNVDDPPPPPPEQPRPPPEQPRPPRAPQHGGVNDPY
eukprot:2350782-Alexandrium_andersonii.AAC.1